MSKPRFYWDWQFYTAISGLILSLALSLYLYSINNRTAKIQEASFRPVLFVEYKGLRFFPEDTSKSLDSIVVQYDIINKGGNTAFRIQVEIPRICPEKLLQICSLPNSYPPPYTSLAVGDTLHREKRAELLLTNPKPIADTTPLYVRFCIRYQDLLQKDHRSYFVVGLSPSYRADTLGLRLFDESQMIE